MADELIRPGLIGLGHHQNIGDLNDPRLEGLNVIPIARTIQEDGGLHGTGDLDLRLSDSGGLDQNQIEPEGVEDTNHVVESRGKPSSRIPARHTADVDSRIEGVLSHPDPVSEDSSLSEGARRIHCRDCHSLSSAPELTSECSGQSALSGSRISSDSNDMGSARQGEKLADITPALLRLSLHPADHSGECSAIPLSESGQ